MYNSKVSISFKFLCLTGDTFTDVFLFQLLVFEVQTYEGLSVYVSVRDTNSLNHLGINGLFAEKLKLKDKQQVSIMKIYIICLQAVWNITLTKLQIWKQSTRRVCYTTCVRICIHNSRLIVINVFFR